MNFNYDFLFYPQTLVLGDEKTSPMITPRINIMELVQLCLRRFPNPKLSQVEVSELDSTVRSMVRRFKRNAEKEKEMKEKGDDTLYTIDPTIPSDIDLMLEAIKQAGYGIFDNNPMLYERYQVNCIEYLESIKNNDKELYDSCIKRAEQMELSESEVEELQSAFKFKFEEWKKNQEVKKDEV